MKTILSAIALLPMLVVCACRQAASTPQALAKALQAALDKGNFDAARKTPRYR